MKKILQKWLGIADNKAGIQANKHSINTLSEWVEEIKNEQIMYSGGTVQQRGVKEHVNALIEYLELRPQETFLNEAKVIEENVRREFKLVKRNKKKL